MNVVLVTGSAGLIGSETARFFHEKGFDVLGIDNDMRRYFFGDDASTRWSRERLESDLQNYRHFELDIRDEAGVERLFKQYGSAIGTIVHDV